MQCRSCGYKTETIFDFGCQYLAGNFWENKVKAQEALKYPLRLNICEACSLLQIENIPERNLFFHEKYSYLTGEIPDLVKHFKNYADWILEKFDISSSILEFGCNDGTLLKFLTENGFTARGIDPSENAVSLGRGKGLEIDIGFFGAGNKIYKEEQFDLITCSNVFAHAPLIKPLTSEAWRLLRQHGVFLVEVHNAEYLLPNQFDSIYHEHAVYYDIASISNHLNANGFKVVNSCKTDMHGAGLRITAQKTDKNNINIPDISNVLVQKQKANKVGQKIRYINEFMAQKFAKRNLDIYGIAGKAQMFYHMTDLSKYVDRAFDDSEIRQSKYIVGSTIHISKYNEETGDILLITAWNYADSIYEKVKNNYSEIYTLLPKIKRWK